MSVCGVGCRGMGGREGRVEMLPAPGGWIPEPLDQQEQTWPGVKGGGAVS